MKQREPSLAIIRVGIRYEQAPYLRWHDSLWLDWMVDRSQIWIHGLVLSSISSIVGVYVGWRINRDYLS